MLFNSFEFAIFFVVVFAAYALLRRSYFAQNILLLAASYLFYGWWDIRFLFLIVLSTGVDFLCGQMVSHGRAQPGHRMTNLLFVICSAFFCIALDYRVIGMEKEGLRFKILGDPLALLENKFHWILFAAGVLFFAGLTAYTYWAASFDESRRRKQFLAISIISNLSILGFFKYFNFFADNLNLLCEASFGVTLSDWTLNIVLPVGISFYTFQTISYTVDVFRGDLKPCRQLFSFAPYVAFFPQLVAGPIERGKHLLPQFEKARPKLTWDDVKSSAWLIAWGLYKKCIVADGMALIVNESFQAFDRSDSGPQPTGFIALIGIYAFAFQIYGDFSGYTDIARGTARLLGFDIMLNFRLPYFAINPSDFWRRWHISLSSWLRDYLYIPLGGNRQGPARTHLNLFLTMLLGGLWHGASWTFVIWGAFHGLLLIGYRLAGLDRLDVQRSRLQFLAMMIIMYHFTCIGWLIFRAPNVQTITSMLEAITLNFSMDNAGFVSVAKFFKIGWFLIAFQFIQFWTNDLVPQEKAPFFVRLNLWIFIVMSLLTGSEGPAQEFIYFAF